MADDAADLLADLQRRIRALETAPRASYTTVRSGVTAWRGAIADHAAFVVYGAGDYQAAAMVYTQDDQSRIYIGTNVDGSVALVRLDNPDKSDTAFRWDSDLGIVGPWGVGAWVKNPTQPINSTGMAQTTSGTAEVGYRTLLNVTSVGSSLDYYVSLGGATSAEVALTAVVRASNRGGVPAAAQTVWTRTITSNNLYNNTANIPSTIWTPAANPIGTLVTLELTCRVASGAGTVAWGPTLPIQLL